MADRLTIVQMNDSHGYIEQHQELFWAGGRAEYRMAGGYARIAGLLNQAREENPERVLAFDCGDTIHGTYPAVTTRGEAMVPLLNAMDFDAMTAHWEFAYGPEQFRKVAGQLKYPMLAINCYDEKTRELVFTPYIVKEAGDLLVGVIGIAATLVDKTMPKPLQQRAVLHPWKRGAARVHRKTPRAGEGRSHRGHLSPGLSAGGETGRGGRWDRRSPERPYP